jgi:hypothetical protein
MKKTVSSTKTTDAKRTTEERQKNPGEKIVIGQTETIHEQEKTKGTETTTSAFSSFALIGSFGRSVYLRLFAFICVHSRLNIRGIATPSVGIIPNHQLPTGVAVAVGLVKTRPTRLDWSRNWQFSKVSKTFRAFVRLIG